GQRAGLEDGHGADVHVAVAVLDLEEAVVERGKALEVRVGHGSSRVFWSKKCALRERPACEREGTRILSAANGGVDPATASRDEFSSMRSAASNPCVAAAPPTGTLSAPPRATLRVRASGRGRGKATWRDAIGFTPAHARRERGGCLGGAPSERGHRDLPDHSQLAHGRAGGRVVGGGTHES